MRTKVCVGLLALTSFLSVDCSRTPAEREAKFLISGGRLAEKGDYQRALLEFQNAARAVPSDAEPNYRMALAYLALHQPQTSVQSLRKALALNPNHVGARVQLDALMTTSSNSRDVEHARSDLEQVVAAAPTDLQGLNALAAAEMKLGDFGRAEEHLKKAVEVNPKDLQTSVDLAKLRMSQKNWIGAEEVLKQVVRVNPTDANARTALAEYYMSVANWAAAEQSYRQELKVDANSVAALSGIAGLQERAGKREEAARVYQQLSKLPGPTKTLYAEFLLKTGKRDVAVREFERLVKALPDDRLTRSRLIALYLSTGKGSEAERLLRDALTKNPKDTDALLQRSRIELAQRKHRQAQADASAVLNFEPNSVEAHGELAAVYRAQGHPMLERQELTELIRLSPGDFPARQRLADLFRAGKSTKAALDLLDQAPANNRRSLAWIIQRNWILLDEGDYSALARGIADGMAIGRAPDLTLQLGILKYYQHNYAAARSAAEELLKVNSGELRAVDLLARCHVAEQQSGAALKVIQDAVTRQPKSAQLQQLLGRFFLYLNRPDEARTAFLEAQRLDANSPAPRNALAEMNLQQRRFEQVRNDLGPLVAQDRADSDAKMILAEAELALGNDTRALELYRKVADEEPWNAKALNNTAFLLTERAHQPNEALKYAQKAVEISPGSPAEEHTLGRVLYVLGVYQQALQHFETAAQKDPKPEHLYYLAAARFKTGHISQGREALRRAMELNPNLPDASIAVNALKQTGN